jgi:hypothetical protein
MAEAERALGIRIAGNTAIPCLQAIVAMGYTVTHYFLGSKPGEGDRPQWDAEKDGRLFSATGLEELLGLIAMWEARGDDWRLKPGEAELYDRLVEAAPMYDAEGNVVDK